MVNNHRREADQNPPLFFMCFGLFLVFCLLKPGVFQAQKIKNHYVSSIQQKGTLYFIRPQKGFKNKRAGSSFVYDMTCFSSSDSVTLNFSYFDKNSRTLDSLYLMAGSIKTGFPIVKIFIETKKSRWHYRFTSRVSLNDLEAFFKATEMGTMALIEKHKPIPLTSTKRRWKKYAAINTRIFQLIRHNK